MQDIQEINTLLPNAPTSYPLKSLVFWCFFFWEGGGGGGGYKMEALARDGLISIVMKHISAPHIPIKKFAIINENYVSRNVKDRWEAGPQVQLNGFE